MPANMVAVLNEVNNAAQSEMADLQDRRKSLHAQKALVTKEIKLKKKRDDRLMAKAARNLSPEALMNLASKKLASREKKARSVASQRGRLQTPHCIIPAGLDVCLSAEYA